jgi:serine/threonine protein kinase/tetratricopeptide (TPR) repeat protein
VDELQDTLWRSALAEFDRVADLSDAARRVELERLARESPDLHQRVRALLEADRRADEGGFLDGDALADVTTGEQQEPGWTLLPDACFGPYRVERPLGKGGMGEVWLARRADGRYEGQVALKFLHPQLSSSAIRRRFAREGQILARLAHPRIARLLDAGVTGGGRLYLVLEYVAGEPLDTWCNARRLDVQARLVLFLQICDAVAHAHAHLVLHRDLKPSNILVADDGRIKLLDFGVAKLVGADTGAAAPTELTEAGGRVFTPEYAAPEQLTNQPATIATDVYALGVVLYRLLTGRRPYGEDARSLGQLERAILEADPPRMSVSLRNADAAALASTHGCTPIQLQKVLRGGLDLIVGKCLRKTPAERYATVRSLADDVTRHLDHRPLLAQPEPWATRGRKFVRRHLVGVAAVAGMSIASAAGVAGVVWQARQTALERDQARREAARAEAVRDYVMLMFRTARDEAGEAPLTARQVLDLSAARLQAEYRDDPALRHRLLQTVAQLYTELDDYQGAASLLEGMVETEASTTDPVVLADSQHLLANIAFRRGDAARARVLLARAQAFWQRDTSRYRGQLLESRLLQAQLEREAGDVPRSIATLRTAVSDRLAQSGPHHYDSVNAINSLALALAGDNQLAEAERLIGEAWDGVRALGRERTGWALVILNNRAGIAARQKDYVRAEALFREAIALRRDLYGPSTALAVMHINLGSILVNTGRPREAVDLLTSALKMATEYSGESSPVTVNVLVKLARAHVPLGHLAQAERYARRALEIARGRFGEQHVLVADAETILARILIAQKRPGDARPLLEHAAATLPRVGAIGVPLLAEVNGLMRQLGSGLREP